MLEKRTTSWVTCTTFTLPLSCPWGHWLTTTWSPTFTIPLRLACQQQRDRHRTGARLQRGAARLIHPQHARFRIKSMCPALAAAAEAMVRSSAGKAASWLMTVERTVRHTCTSEEMTPANRTGAGQGAVGGVRARNEQDDACNAAA